MKKPVQKLIAFTAAVSVLFVCSSVILAEKGKSSNASSNGAKDKIQQSIEDCEENIEANEEQYADQQQKIEEKKARIEEKKAAFATKKEEFEAFKDALFARKREMLDMNAATNQLHAENAKLQGDLRNSLESLEENGIVLSDEVRQALEESMTKIREITGLLKDSKGQIQDILQTNRGFIKDRDYVSMETAFDEIYAIQQYRNECLTQINTLLQDMIKLLVTVV